jgi:CRISPR/Cas system-associated exonuclease Cas4 (RecB family)
MSEYYNAQRTRNMYDPKKPFKLSRSKIEDFMNCPRCFWLDRVKGIGQPPGYPFSLNVAVDALLKKEFDLHREAQTPHPLMVESSLKMVPFKHPDMDTWRSNFKGLQFHHEPTQLTITGAVDDLWMTLTKVAEIVVADYKATSKAEKVSLDADWQIGYKRQMEIYQWILRQLGFRVSDTGYFVYANGKADRDGFNARLEFDITLLHYTGDSSWVEETLFAIKKCLDGKMPKSGKDCDFCAYYDARKCVI